MGQHLAIAPQHRAGDALGIEKRKEVDRGRVGLDQAAQRLRRGARGRQHGVGVFQHRLEKRRQIVRIRLGQTRTSTQTPRDTRKSIRRPTLTRPFRRVQAECRT
jgi:hypothetical protein